jgi:hypothetical protein
LTVSKEGASFKPAVGLLVAAAVLLDAGCADVRFVTPRINNEPPTADWSTAAAGASATSDEDCRAFIAASSSSDRSICFALTK